MSSAHQVADLLLLVLVAGAVTVLGRNAGPSWSLLSAGISAFVVTDTVHASQIGRDSCVDGGVLDLGRVVAIVCFGLAAWHRSCPGTASRLDGLAALAVPGVSALGAVLAALGRTALMFREIRTLADTRRQARTASSPGCRARAACTRR